MKLLSRVVLGCFISILLALASMAHAAPADPLEVKLPELEIIPGASWYWVGRQMALDGMPMSVKMFSYRGSPKNVVDFYLSTWKVMGNGKLRNDSLGSRIILGYELDEFFYSVQLEVRAGVVEGKVVVTPTPLNYRTSRSSLLPIPPRSKVLSKVESLDGGKREETLSIDSRFDVSYVADFYTDQLVADGWLLLFRRGDQSLSATLNFQRGSELLQLTAKGLQQGNSKGCQVLIHWIK